MKFKSFIIAALLILNGCQNSAFNVKVKSPIKFAPVARTFEGFGPYEAKDGYSLFTHVNLINREKQTILISDISVEVVDFDKNFKKPVETVKEWSILGQKNFYNEVAKESNQDLICSFDVEPWLGIYSEWASKPIKTDYVSIKKHSSLGVWLCIKCPVQGNFRLKVRVTYLDSYGSGLITQDLTK